MMAPKPQGSTMALGLGVFNTCFLLLVLTVAISYAHTLHELCKVKNRAIHLLEETESAILIINSSVDSRTRNITYPRFKNRCNLEYKVCPSCHFDVVIKNMTIPCSQPECQCGFFEIKEVFPQHKLKYCGNYNATALYFESKTRHIALDFVQTGSVFHVTINITARRNYYTITGIPFIEHFIESPYFPSKYPPDYSAEYIFHSLDPKGRVQLLFSDFQIMPQSYIEVFGHSGYRVDTYTGKTVRPPVFTSSGIQMILKFEANSKQESKSGFRAQYKFFRSDWNSGLGAPYTDCGGIAESHGGTIVVNVLGGEEELVDCIWLVNPPLFPHRNLFSATIAQFQDVGKGSFLEFRKGLTSVAPIAKTFECRTSDCSPERLETTFSALVGIYIRFRGHMRKESSIIISYCTFSERDCDNDEFECSNGRCIQKFLLCDGFDHCTDNSDEEKCQDEISSSTTTRSARMITRAPKVIKESIPAGITSLIVVTAVSGLSLIIFAVGLIVHKLYKQRSIRRELHQVQPFLGGAEEVHTLHICENEENPPSYEDVLKFSGRFPRLSYTSQTDAETNCSFSDFQCRSEEILCAGGENLPSNDAQLNSKNSTAQCSFIHPSESPSSKRIHESTRRLCRSLESKVNQCCCQQRPHSFSNIQIIENEFVVLQTMMPYKHVRCMTLPPDYKFPPRNRINSNADCNKSMQKGDCSTATKTESQLTQCTCSLINEILPLSRNRGSSDPHQVTIVDLHSFFREKASTF